MKHDQNGFYPHKVGYVHYHGTILADALKYDKSGKTVAMYEKGEKYAKTGESGYVVVEWDKSGEYETNVAKYDKYEEALFSYLSTAFGVDL